MKNTIENIKDIANHIQDEKLIISTSQLIHSYENNTIDEYDIYTLTRDVLSLLSNIAALRSEIESLA